MRDESVDPSGLNDCGPITRYQIRKDGLTQSTIRLGEPESHFPVVKHVDQCAIDFSDSLRNVMLKGSHWNISASV